MPPVFFTFKSGSEAILESALDRYFPFEPPSDPALTPPEPPLDPYGRLNLSDKSPLTPSEPPSDPLWTPNLAGAAGGAEESGDAPAADQRKGGAKRRGRASCV
eukprot:3621784-Pyramimonas_sp.AAC.1